MLCTPCDVGEYQDELGQTQCKKCLPGKALNLYFAGFYGSNNLSTDNSYNTKDLCKHNSVFHIKVVR